MRLIKTAQPAYRFLTALKHIVKTWVKLVCMVFAALGLVSTFLVTEALAQGSAPSAQQQVAPSSAPYSEFQNKQNSAPTNGQVNSQMMGQQNGQSPRSQSNQFKNQLNVPAPMGSVNSPMGIDHSYGLSQRDPFRLPQYLILRIKEKAMTNRAESGGVDDSVEPIRRWPLAAYQLVGIIWDVKKPKAMFLDRQNTIHMVHLKDVIGSGKAVVSSINNGEVIVIENKTPLKIRLKK